MPVHHIDSLNDSQFYSQFKPTLRNGTLIYAISTNDEGKMRIATSNPAWLQKELAIYGVSSTQGRKEQEQINITTHSGRTEITPTGITFGYEYIDSTSDKISIALGVLVKEGLCREKANKIAQQENVAIPNSVKLRGIEICAAGFRRGMGRY